MFEGDINADKHSNWPTFTSPLSKGANIGLIADTLDPIRNLAGEPKYRPNLIGPIRSSRGSLKYGGGSTPGKSRASP